MTEWIGTTVAITQQFLPIFALFEDSKKAADFLAEKGTKFSDFSDIEFYPLNYLLCMGYKNQAEQFLNLTVSALPKAWQKNIFDLYLTLPNTPKILMNVAEVTGACQVKMAYVHGLKLQPI